MRVVGLTGGIATGKSTVTKMLRDLGATVIDADEVAREVVEPGQPALAEIAARFPGVVGPDGRLDRAALGERIFGDDAARRTLNAIVHPRVQERFLELTAQAAAQGTELVVYDAALLIENRLHEALGGVILVVAPPEVQLRRLMERNGLDEAAARARIASQLPLEDKRAHATWVIDNGGPLEATRAQVQALWRSLSTDGGAGGPRG